MGKSVGGGRLFGLAAFRPLPGDAQIEKFTHKDARKSPDPLALGPCWPAWSQCITPALGNWITTGQRNGDATYGEQAKV